jgi:hypothetical protein
MPSPTTRKTITALLERLNAVYQRHDPATLTAMGHGWHDALGDLDAEQLDGAVTLAIRDEQRFPTPAKLREHARTWRERNRLHGAPVARTDDAGHGRCRYCHAEPRLARLNGIQADGTPGDVLRYIIPCDTSRPHPHGYVPYPAEFRCWDTGP